MEQNLTENLIVSQVRYHAQKNPPVDTKLSQINPVHNLTPYFFNIDFNIR